MWPPHSNSHHQDYYIFSRGFNSYNKPLFATGILGRGNPPKINLTILLWGWDVSSINPTNFREGSDGFEDWPRFFLSTCLWNCSWGAPMFNDGPSENKGHPNGFQVEVSKELPQSSLDWSMLGFKPQQNRHLDHLANVFFSKMFLQHQKENLN